MIQLKRRALSRSPVDNATKYLNNIIEQDHRNVKRLTRADLGFKSFSTARRTIDGYETMHMIRKGQVMGIEKGAIKEQRIFIEELFGIAA
jgi:transposase, IS6 family